MRDHRTDPGSSDDDSRDPVSSAAADFAARVERWLGGHDGPPDPALEEVTQDAIERAWWFVAAALEFALAVPGLPEDGAAELARHYERATRLSGYPANEDLLGLRTTSARRERLAWFEEHGDRASEEGGIDTWTALPDPIRWVLTSARLLTIAEVQDLAARGELLSVPGIGPARQRVIMKALAALPPAAGPGEPA